MSSSSTIRSGSIRSRSPSSPPGAWPARWLPCAGSAGSRGNVRRFAFRVTTRPMNGEPVLAFAVHEHEPPALEVRVNFGMFAGREATPAEIDGLAASLLDQVGAVSIVAEERHEIDDHSEAAIHQVRIEVGTEALPAEPQRPGELGAGGVAATRRLGAARLPRRATR